MYIHRLPRGFSRLPWDLSSRSIVMRFSLPQSCLFPPLLFGPPFSDPALSIAQLHVKYVSISLPPDPRQPGLSYGQFRRSVKTFLFGQWDLGAVWTLLTAPSRNILIYLFTYLRPPAESWDIKRSNHAKTDSVHGAFNNINFNNMILILIAHFAVGGHVYNSLCLWATIFSSA